MAGNRYTEMWKLNGMEQIHGLWHSALHTQELILEDLVLLAAVRLPIANEVALACFNTATFDRDMIYGVNKFMEVTTVQFCYQHVAYSSSGWSGKIPVLLYSSPLPICGQRVSQMYL